MAIITKLGDPELAFWVTIGLSAIIFVGEAKATAQVRLQDPRIFPQVSQSPPERLLSL